MSTSRTARRAALASAVALSLSIAGCGWLARAGTVKISGWANPKYRDQVASVPVQMGPILDCSSHRTDVAPSEKTHTWLAQEFFPQVWTEVGGTGTPEIERPDEDSELCQQLYLDWFDDDGRDWKKEDGGPTLKAIAASLLGDRTDENVFVVAFGTRYYCTPVTRDVRDAQGNLLGTVATGAESCQENGEINVAGYLLSPAGELLFLSGGRIQHFAWFEPKDAKRAADAFVGKYPASAGHARVAASP